MVIPDQFINALCALEFENTFNPYSQRCAHHDHKDAPKRRRNALRKVLKVATQTEIDSLWIGRDLGYQGGRRTGLAFTDDSHLPSHAERWGISIEKPTHSKMAERTATIIWSVLKQIDAPVFLWNVFPLHPHEANNPFSNRAHNARERSEGENLLSQLINMLEPSRLIAIGKDAAAVAQRLGGPQQVIPMRHPSYGGQKKFLAQIHDVYNTHKRPPH